MITPQLKTKNGAASLFVVIFTILLLGVITLGFTRLILSEATQSSNNDLSQSAYDSALAGVEDAKVALLKYHDCLSEGHTDGDGSSCATIIKEMQSGISNQSCDVVSKVLGRSTEENGEVMIQETQNSSDSGNAAAMDQAYTCVTIQENLGDYRTTLEDSNRVRIVPIRSDNIQDIDKITLKWFSDTNAVAANYVGGGTPAAGSLPSIGSASSSNIPTPPLISVQFFQADASFNLSELSASADSSHTDRATLYLQPVASGGDYTSNTDNDVIPADAVANTANKSQNSLFTVNCSAGTFYCSVDIRLPRTFRGESRNEGATFLLITLPYGQPQTDISVTLKKAGTTKSEDTSYSFSGVQARIDSTGRANDLYRRVESRVELVDTYFPYPEFAVQMADDSNSTIKKDFYITQNCWYSDGDGNKPCPANGDVK